MSAEVLKRLESLYRHADEEGWHVHANTVFLAIQEINRLQYLEQLEAHLHAGGKPPEPTDAMLQQGGLVYVYPSLPMSGRASPHAENVAKRIYRAMTEAAWNDRRPTNGDGHE